MRVGIQILLAFSLAFFSVARIATITPTGQQCSTAPVQSILVAVHLPCGHVEYVSRAPRPGDKGFLQCRCSEKRSSTQAVPVAPEMPLLRAAIEVVARPLPAEQFSAIDFSAASFLPISDSPKPRPPATI
jgi:hypothetical protein